MSAKTIHSKTFHFVKVKKEDVCEQMIFHGQKYEYHWFFKVNWKQPITELQENKEVIIPETRATRLPFVIKTRMPK